MKITPSHFTAIALTVIVLVNFWQITNKYFTTEIQHQERPRDVSDNKKSTGPSQRVVRTTKTRTQSRILGNGDMVEQTVVKEVTETVTTSLCREETCEECQGRCFSEAEEDDQNHEAEEVEDDQEDEEGMIEMDDGMSGLSTPYSKLATGLACCISHLVTSGPHHWTFHLVGLTSSPPSYCMAQTCIYTRDNHNHTFCFSSSSCVNNITSLHRVSPPSSQVTEESLLTEEDRRRMKNISSSESKAEPFHVGSESCCPLKSVASERYPHLSGIYILYGKYPLKKNKLCTDNCVYMMAEDKETQKYCFAGGTESVLTSCHNSLPAGAQLPDHSQVIQHSSDTPIPLTATSLESVLDVQPTNLRLEPFVLNKTEKPCSSDCQISTDAYPYLLYPKTEGDEKSEKSNANLPEERKNSGENAIPLKLMKEEGTGTLRLEIISESDREVEEKGLSIEKLSQLKKKEAGGVTVEKIPQLKKVEITEKKGLSVEKLSELNKQEVGGKKSLSVEKLSELKKEVGEKEGLSVEKLSELKKIEEGKKKGLSVEKLSKLKKKEEGKKKGLSVEKIHGGKKEEVGRNKPSELKKQEGADVGCDKGGKGGLRVEKPSLQQRPLQIKKKKEEPVEMCQGGGPVMIRTNEKPEVIGQHLVEKTTKNK